MKKTLIWSMIAVLMLFFFPPMEAKAAGSDWKKAYETIIQNYYNAGNDENKLEKLGLNAEAAGNDLYYTYKDLDGNGVPELFISYKAQPVDYWDEGYPYHIIDMYCYDVPGGMEDGKNSAFRITDSVLYPQYSFTIRKNNLLLCDFYQGSRDSYLYVQTLNPEFLALMETYSLYRERATLADNKDVYLYYESHDNSFSVDNSVGIYMEASDYKKVSASAWTNVRSTYPLDWGIQWKSVKPSYTYNITGMKDVPDTMYYAQPIKWGLDNKITNGTSATAFGPESPCTRAQVATFLWRAAGSPNPATTYNPFRDVKSSDYYYKAVLWAVEKDITYGTSATAFSPNASCTRGQVVTFLYRSIRGLNPSTTYNPFKDVYVSDYYYDPVLWAVDKDITSGTSATTFSPDKTCTRGQIMTFLYRASKIPAPKDLKVATESKDETINEGEQATLTVHITGGTPPYTYQWRQYKNGGWVNAEGASTVNWSQTGCSYTARPTESTQYSCVITDSSGQQMRTTTRTFNVTVIPAVVQPLTIVTQPRSLTVVPEDTALLSVTINGGKAPYRYEWQVRTDGVWVNAGSPVTTTAVTDTYRMRPAEEGVYRCMITDSSSSAQKIVSNIAEISMESAEPLEVSVSPKTIEIEKGEAVNLRTSATGGEGPYTYQWQVRETYGWVDCHEAGANSPRFTPSPTESIGYRCIVSDSGDPQSSVTSEIITVYVTEPEGIEPLTITEQPKGVTGTVGDPVELKVSVSGGTVAYQYRWERKDAQGWTGVKSDYSNATSSSLTVEASEQAKDYRCIITDNSDPANVVTSNTVSVVGNPVAAPVAPGEELSPTHIVIPSALNVRQQPGTDSLLLGGLRSGDKVVVVETQGGWSKIHYGERFGWVESQYLEAIV